jgi:hypothetical protein
VPARPVTVNARLVHNTDTAATITISSTSFREQPELSECREEANGSICPSSYDNRMTMTLETTASSIVLKTALDGFDELKDSCPDITVPLEGNQPTCSPQYVFYVGGDAPGTPRKCEATCVTGEFSKLPLTRTVYGYGETQAEADEHLLAMKPLFEEECAAAGGEVAWGSHWTGSATTHRGYKILSVQEGLCK